MPSRTQRLAFSLNTVTLLLMGNAETYRFQLSRVACSGSKPTATLCRAYSTSHLALTAQLYVSAGAASNLSKPSTWADSRPHPNVLELASPEVKASVQNYFDVLYTITAEIGTPPAPVRLVVDTGSSDIWVKSGIAAGPVGTTAVSDKSKRTVGRSSTGQHFMIRYGQGEVAGVGVQDRFCLSTLCLDNQSFILAEIVVGIPAEWLFDGVLGLGFPGLAQENPQVSLLQRLNTEFEHLAVGLCIRSKDTSQSGGYLTIGEIGELQEQALAKFGEGVTVPLWGINHQALFWLVLIEATVFDGTEMKVPEGEAIAMAIVDSGTSFITVPGIAYFWLLQALMAGQSDAGEKCTFTNALGLIQLVCLCDAQLNSLMFTIPGEDGHKLQVVLESRDLMVGGPILCQVALMQSPPALPVWILGDAFLRHVYVVHDVPSHKIHLFPQEGSLSTSVSKLVEPSESKTPGDMATLATVTVCAAVAALVALLAWITLRHRAQGFDTEYSPLDSA